MYALQEITPAMLSRFTQIDYDREMALIATIEKEGAERQIGVARYVTMLGEESCEFAIVIADNWQGRGLATRLLKTLIEIARDRRLRFMEGVVLRENRNMLSLAESIGFDLSPDDQDPEVVNLMLRL
jgi:acetyltransferase